jgi:hypothetical protein
MEEDHISETYCLSLREKGKRHAQTKWLYLNRTFGSDCHHCVIDGCIDAGTAAGKEAGKGGSMSVERSTMGAYLSIVR